ncbi:MAG: MarR family transcriptional regulator [Flavobacteriaceae bacterium]|jgi:DNA-binding MarR family transcriptional regulator|nr:MarR family transcriptional regulator [Flavobacteriaceae bacterium]NVJ72122.1 MarR family transcriptional regulator [Flavobacteriaceae bacterium]
MNVEEKIKSTVDLAPKQRTIIHLSLICNSINDQLNKALKAFDVSIEQFNVLRILRGQKGVAIAMKDINERMVSKMSNTTRLVDKLVNKRFVTRNICPENRRKMEILITDLGASQLQQMDMVIEQTHSKILEELSDVDIQTLNTLLNKFN